MHLLDFFYYLGWVNAFLIIMFCTDALYIYLRLFGLYKDTQAEYGIYLANNNYDTFISFLQRKGQQSNSKTTWFLLKLITCPLCLAFWLTLTLCFLTSNLAEWGCLYIATIITFLMLKKVIEKLL
jgi:hypothetical protein